ncbi:GWxTD domain-containing protein [bacterium]|nr:GWxTD domain-containing protein [bacterium]
MKKTFLLAVLLGLNFPSAPAFSQSSGHDDIKESIKTLKKELKNHPEDSQMRFELAELCLSEDEYGEIIDLYEKKFDKKECSAAEYKMYAVARIRNFEKMVITGKILSKMPIASMFHSDLSDAKKALERALQKDSSDVEAKFFEGVLLRVDGKGVEAEKIFREIVAADPYFKTYIFYDAWMELGALLRKQERWKEANEFLEKRAALDSADTWPMIQLALSYIDVKKDEDATRAFYRGLRSVSDQKNIEQLYSEALPIATKEEINAWKVLAAPADQLQFLQTFWKSRDPNLVDAVNERLVEHYRRVQYARAYYKKIRSPYFDDRGLVYIKMGKPDKMFTGVNDASWVYESTNEHFDFVDVGQGVYEIRPLSDAVPLAGSAAQRFAALYNLLDERRNYHADYERLANRMKSAENSVSVERNAQQVLGIYQSNLNMIEQQLNTITLSKAVHERFDFNTGAEPLPINANFATFRSTNSSRLDFYYMIPVQRLKFMPVENVHDKSFLTVKAKIFDTTYQEINYLERDYRITSVDSTLQSEYYIIDELRSLLKPGNYLMALDIRNNLNEKIGIYKINLRVRDYSLRQLTISDIEISSSVSQQVITDKFIKPDTKLRVVPNPAGSSPKSKPLTIYYEIYDLTLDNEGRSSYEVSYTIDSKSKKNFFAKLFSGNSRISSTTLKTGASTLEREYIAFDISELPVGEASLKVTVKDMHSMRDAISSVKIKISK